MLTQFLYDIKHYGTNTSELQKPTSPVFQQHNFLKSLREITNLSETMPTWHLIRWPDHWYHDHHFIHCIVSGCGYVTDVKPTSDQWAQIRDHCTNATGPEHGLLAIMLTQTICAIDNCNHPSFATGKQDLNIRHLFMHEKTAHGSQEMSNICSFVRLAREGRIRVGGPGGHTRPVPNCERLAYKRMMEKVQALPAPVINMIFQRSWFIEHTTENLGKILTDDHLAKPGEDPPYWWPIRAEHFLWSCRPKASDPPNSHWRVIWTELRKRYADGRI